MENKYLLNNEDVLALGYTQEQIDNAPRYSSFDVPMEQQLYDEYHIQKKYCIVDNKLRVEFEYIDKGGYMVQVRKNRYDKFAYSLYINPLHTTMKTVKDPISYDSSKFAYTGNRIVKFNKKNFDNYLDCVVKDMDYKIECHKEKTNNLEKGKEVLLNLGFKFDFHNNPNKASIYTKQLNIEVEVCENGSIHTTKIQQNNTMNLEQSTDFLKKLIEI